MSKKSKVPKRPKPAQMLPPSARSREEVLAGFYDASGERRGLPLARILLRILEVLVDIRDRGDLLPSGQICPGCESAIDGAHAADCPASKGA